MGKIRLEQVVLNVLNSSVEYDLGNGASNEVVRSSDMYTSPPEDSSSSSSAIDLHVEELTQPAGAMAATSEDLTYYTEGVLSTEGVTPNDGAMSAEVYSFDISELPDKPDYDWVMQDGDEELWNNLDLDWLSKTELNMGQVVTTEHPLYKPKIYEQSVSVFISAMGNETSVQDTDTFERALEVGPWRVTQHQLPYLLGSLAGFCLLVILVTSLALYMCFHKRRTTEQYNVKSEASSVSSGRICAPSNSLSRDSLIVVGSAPNGHQARLYSESSAAHNMLFDRNFDFYFTLPKAVVPCDVIKPSKSYSNVNPEMDSDNCHKNTNLKNQFSNPRDSELISDTMERRFSTDCGEMSEILENRSLRKGNSLKEITSDDKTHWRKHTRREYSKSICSQGRYCDHRKADGRFDMKTNSLPAWAKDKQSATKDKLMFLVYDKCCDKNGTTGGIRRKRMGSDTAQVIALSKSITPLLNNSDSSKEDSINFYDQPDYCNCAEDEIVNDNNVVIVYNERTAL